LIWRGEHADLAGVGQAGNGTGCRREEGSMTATVAATFADERPFEAAPTAWTWSSPGPVPTGSEAHKNLFCRMLLETHDPYRPEDLVWPDLDGAARERLAGLPFWTVAVETEDRAGTHIGQVAAIEPDPLVREALALMASEERRHRRILEILVERYGLPLEARATYVPSARAMANFLSTGYGECLDSFFAFGLFELARRSGFFPVELVETFEPVIQEEARHLLFFVNWAAYTQANLPPWSRPWFLARRLWAAVDNGRGRLGLANVEGDVQFAREGRGSIGIDVSFRGFLDLCLAENERRMSRMDRRLLRPAIMPRLARTIRPFAPRR
jgi:hypothetical protein